MMEPIARILISDPDYDFLKSLKDAATASGVEPILAPTGKDAVRALREIDKPLSAVFVHPLIRNPDWVSVVRYSHQFRTAMPIFLLEEGTEAAKPSELEHLGIQESVKKPVDFKRLVKLALPAGAAFDQQAAIATAHRHTDRVDEEVRDGDISFKPIRAADFLAGTKSFFDVYVQLGSGRFIKILHAGDSFYPARVSSYLGKGVTHFYVRKEAQELYLGYCEKIATALLKRTDVAADVKGRRVLAQGEEAISYLRNFGVSKRNMEHAERFVANTRDLAKQMRKAESSVLARFMKDIRAYEHGVAVAAVAGLLGDKLGIEAESSTRIVGLSALLHDIGLYHLGGHEGRAAAIRDEDEAAMTPAQFELYKTHPEVGAKVLEEKVKGLDTVVIQAVARHHQRRTKRGFPPRPASSPLHPVAEIVGVADEFVRLTKRAEKDSHLSIRGEMENDLFNGFTFKTCQAFREIFFPGKT